MEKIDILKQWVESNIMLQTVINQKLEAKITALEDEIKELRRWVIEQNTNH